MVLFTELFVDNKDNIDFVKKNLSSQFFTKIFVFVDEKTEFLIIHPKVVKIKKRLSNVSQIFDFAKSIVKSDICVISNSNLSNLAIRFGGLDFNSKIHCFENVHYVFNTGKVDKFANIVNIDMTQPEQMISRVSKNKIKTTSNIISPSNKLDTIIVSVDYNDYLSITLENNFKFLQNIHVVTSSKDLVCQDICKQYGVDCIITDKFYESNSIFNKGKAINYAISKLENPDWILILDADIILKNSIDVSNLNYNVLYSCKRIIIETYDQYLDFDNQELVEEPGIGFGYFQLFNFSSRYLNKRMIYPEVSRNASKSDIIFKRQFKSIDDLKSKVYHLGKTRLNWNGRKSEIFSSQVNNKDESILSISKRDDRIKPKLAIITTFFNPKNYINLKYNYLKFLKNLKNKSDLFTIELSFNGDFFIEGENVIRIQGKEENVLWQKERLLNIALNQIPAKYTNIAWIDCDIIFENENWIDECNNKLQNYKVVQLYETANRLNEDGEVTMVSKGIIKRIEEINSIDINLSKGIPGFAWAIRREVIDKFGFLDTQIIGGGDSLMCQSFLGERDGFVSNQMNGEWFIRYNDWFEKAYSEVGKSVNYVSGSITHLYHGKMKNRKYNDRYKVLSNHRFDPSTHLSKDQNGLWCINNDKIVEDLKLYFDLRNEDDNVIDINTYFDRVFVINLDRNPEKYTRIKNKLDELNIKFERFSAIDGLYLDYELPIFKPGKGMIENKFALGCLLSHQEIFKISKSRGYKRILIFEDDILISKNIDIMIQNIRNLKNWKMIYFGASQYHWDIETYSDDFYLSKKTLGAFAYAADSSIFDEILTLLESKSKSVDNLLSEIQSKYYGQCFTFYPNVCIADVSESNIRNKRDTISHSIKMRWNLLDNYL